MNSQENSLNEDQLRLEGIVDSAMDAIIAVDSSQRIILFNPAAEVMFGAKRADVLGESISQFIPERHRAHHDDHIKRFRQTGVTARRMGALGSISGLRADGEEFPIEASISQAVVNGEALSTVILRDITERRANEQARAILAREVDHRAKNALAIVQSMVSLTDGETKEAYAVALSGRINTLARAHSLLAKSHWRGAELNQLVREETQAYAQAHQVWVQGPHLTLSATSVQPIGLVFHELSTNAMKYGAFSRPGGLVKVTWRRLPNAQLEMNWLETGGPLVEKPQSVGFGSTLINTLIVRQLRGELNVEWLPEGMRIRLLLPEGNILTKYAHASDVVVAPKKTYDESEEGRVPHKRILVVEDEVLLGMELGRALRDAGWSVVGPATSVTESFELLQSESFDVVALDVNLRGEKVYPFADALAVRQIPFIFFTGYEELEHQGRYKNVPVVRKPGSFHSVDNALRSVLPPASERSF